MTAPTRPTLTPDQLAELLARREAANILAHRTPPLDPADPYAMEKTGANEWSGIFAANSPEAIAKFGDVEKAQAAWEVAYKNTYTDPAVVAAVDEKFYAELAAKTASTDVHLAPIPPGNIAHTGVPAAVIASLPPGTVVSVSPIGAKTTAIPVEGGFRRFEHKAGEEWSAIVAFLRHVL